MVHTSMEIIYSRVFQGNASIRGVKDCGSMSTCPCRQLLDVIPNEMFPDYYHDIWEIYSISDHNSLGNDNICHPANIFQGFPGPLETSPGIKGSSKIPGVSRGYANHVIHIEKSEVYLSIGANRPAYSSCWRCACCRRYFIGNCAIRDEEYLCTVRCRDTEIIEELCTEILK